MKKGSTFILKSAICLIGLIVLAICLVALPLGLASDQTGYYKPILIGLYLPALPFFYALYQALRILKLIDQNKVFSKAAVRAMGVIKYSALAITALFALGMPYIYYAAERDDAPGVILIGLIIGFASFVIATAAAVLRRLLQSAVAIKSENDLTV